MEFLKYSNETQTNIFQKEDFENLVQDVFNVISENISRSLGPLGSSATILEGSVEPVATKDGYSILDKYNFRNDYKRMIYNLIKAPCTKMNNIVGDGTSTAITLTSEMFNQYKERRDVLNTMYRLPRQFIKMWDKVIAELQTKIMEEAKPINPKDYDTIYNLAYVTSNGNEEVSKAIAEVYSEAEAPYIKQKDSPTDKSYIEMVKGFNFPANLLSEVYARNQDMTSEESDISVMVFNFKLETDFFKTVIIPINEVLRASGSKLLIIAPAYDTRMCDTLLSQYTLMEKRSPYGINLILTQYSGSDVKGNQLLDMCTVLRTKVINNDIGKKLVEQLTDSNADSVVDNILNNIDYDLYRAIGKCEHALLSMTAGSLLRAYEDIVDDEFYHAALNNARHTLQVLIDGTDTEGNAFSHKVHDARDRVLQLEMKNYIYYVGASSRMQKRLLWDSITDVIKCVRSAVKCGVIPGCQITIIRLCDSMIMDTVRKYPENIRLYDLKTEDQLLLEIVMIIRNACVRVYERVLSGPDKNGMVKLLDRWQYTADTEEAQAVLDRDAAFKLAETIRESISRNAVFDMETLEYNDNIITSAETDQLVLLAASELVKILISGNQAIIIRADVDSSHEEQVMM